MAHIPSVRRAQGLVLRSMRRKSSVAKYIVDNLP